MRKRPPSALLAAALVLLAVNLRPAAASVGPLVHRIRTDTGLSATGAGVLVTLPVLCFGGLAPLAPALGRRIGAHATLCLATAVLLVGLLVRIIGGIPLLFLGTLVAGAAIAVANVLLPVVVRRDFPERTGLMTGIYSTALIGFAALAAGVSVPIDDALGGGWRPGLAIWALPAGIALLVWVPQLRARGKDVVVEGEHLSGARPLLRDAMAWQVTLFFAIQAAGFYATLAWLPSVFQTHGASESYAGFLLSISLIVGLVGALTVPSTAVRVRDQRLLVGACMVCTAVGWIGILVSPMSIPYVWCALLGLGQNSAFPLALTLIVLRGGAVKTTTALSTLAQTVGYLIAAVAPLGIGALHDATASWTPPLIVLLALVLPQTLAGMGAGRSRVVLDRV